MEYVSINREIEYNGATLTVHYLFNPGCKGDNMTPPVKADIEIQSVYWVTFCAQSGNICKVDIYPVLGIKDSERLHEILTKKHENKW